MKKITEFVIVTIVFMAMVSITMYVKRAIERAEQAKAEEFVQERLMKERIINLMKKEND